MKNYTIIKKHLSNVSKTKLENITGIVIHCDPDYYDNNIEETFNLLSAKNKEEIDYGYHYVIDDESNKVYELIPPDITAINISGKPTYISRSLFDEKPNNSLLSVALCITEDKEYEKTEQKFILFLVALLKTYNLTAKDIWRGFDLGKNTYGPFHMLSKDIFKKLIIEIEKYVLPSDTNGGITEGIPNEELIIIKDKEENDEIIIESPFKEVAELDNISINDYVFKIFRSNKDSASRYASKYQPWDKDRDDAKDPESVSEDLQTRETPGNNMLQYKITENSPLGLDHCEKPVDSLIAIETTQDTLVEPIYPDLITPPGDNVHIADGFSESKVQSSNNTPLTAEELEKRQKTFDFSKFDNMKKETKGRPVNVEDPFPVDDQINKLEEHYPKVKVDKVTFDLKDTNHPNSEIGNAIAKNYAMAYDMVTEVAKRTEQRLVKIENNLSTVMRNLFRMSSRVNINCVYYGGQSVLGKYKCIRCLQDDRINDGAIVTMDQCMNCTRYEPILGQVYAILDETGSNIVQVMDDLQMSYLDLNDYKNLNSVSGYHEELNNAKVDQHSPDIPKPFIDNKWKDTKEESESKKTENAEVKNNESEDLLIDKADIPKEEVKEVLPPNGFKMDWTPVKLETQEAHINEYKAEHLKADKAAVKSDTQGIDRFIYNDSRNEAIEYERLEFDVKDYEFPDFGVSDIVNVGSGGSFGMGAMEVRQKIIDYAMAAVALSDAGKAGYWLDGTHRNCHDGNTCGAHGEKQFWDCSSLTRDAYKSAGFGIIGQLTYDQFDKCKTNAGGLLIPITSEDQALPGDIVFFHDGVGKNLSTEKLQNVDNGGIRHVGIYTGEGMVAHAASEKWGIKHTELNWDKGSFCFGRPRELIELDNQAGAGNVTGNWSREYHNISDELWNASSVGESNANGFIGNCEKYKYGPTLVKVAQQKKIDPYFVAAICSVESSGDPTLGGPHPGIMQCTGGYPATTLEGIEKNFNIGIDGILEKGNWLKSKGWTDTNMHLLATAHNTGTYGTTDALGLSQESTSIVFHKKNAATIKIPEASEAIANYIRKAQPQWSVDVKRTYATKVLRAYNVLYIKNILNLPRENVSPGVTTPEGMLPIQKKQIAYNTGKRTGAIKYIAIHDTANPGGTAQNHFDYFNGGNRNASADYFTDSGAIIEISNPDKYYCWHVGDGEGRKGITNQNSIGIEICLESNSTIHPNTLNNTINLTKFLMNKYKIPKSNVVRHYDASGKTCPNKLSSNNWAKWNEFKSKL